MNSALRTTILVSLAAAAVACSGCSTDEASPAAPGAVIDTAPPAVPTGLVAAVSDLRLKLQWEPNTDLDLAGYRVYEMAYGGVHALVTEPIADNHWTDPSPQSNPCDYAVTAVDAAGNESAWALVHWSGAAVPPQRDAAAHP